MGTTRIGQTADGKTVSYKSPSSVTVVREGGLSPREARLFASIGEIEPFSFLLGF